MLELARLARREVETTTRLLGVLEARGWIAKLDPDLHSERWVLIANPRHIDLLAVFNALVIDRKELEYQVRLSTTPFDGESLLARSMRGASMSRLPRCSVARDRAAPTNPRKWRSARQG